MYSVRGLLFLGDHVRLFRTHNHHCHLSFYLYPTGRVSLAPLRLAVTITPAGFDWRRYDLRTVWPPGVSSRAKENPTWFAWVDTRAVFPLAVGVYRKHGPVEPLLDLLMETDPRLTPPINAVLAAAAAGG